MMLIAPDATTAVAWHTTLEMAGIFIGIRLFGANVRKHAIGPITGDHGFAVALGCVIGAIVGSRLAVFIDRPDRFLESWSSLRVLMMGQSIVGALIGGLVGVELAKRRAGIALSAGDAFVVPLAVGIAIGRIGCFVAGLHDDTYGTPTALPWGVDFGDGARRHPTQLYDIAFVTALACLLSAWQQLSRVPGLRFKLFLAAYLLWRLVVDMLKPMPFVYPGGLSGLQWLCVAFLIAYAPALRRGVRALAAQSRVQLLSTDGTSL
jgi:phosphatidylglycerol:prolipoprotein diacylglycerol transferase